MMCGIIACRTDTPAVDYLLTALRRLKYRGYDSVGIAVRTTTGRVVRLRSIEHVGALEREVRSWVGPEFAGAGIGHTRWATHGSVSEVNAHPHNDCTGRISLVHNGTIENAVELRKALAAAGHEFASSVDSEVLSHLIEERIDDCGDLLGAVKTAFAAAEGSWGVAVLDQMTGRIVVAAHHSPLLIARSAEGDFAASDIAAIAEWADEVRVLEDGDVIDLSSTDWRDHHEGRAITTMSGSSWRDTYTGLDGYCDYMAKEIDEQPAAAARVLDELSGGVANGTLWADLGLAPFDRVQVLGCGTSLNAGRVIGNLVQSAGGLPVTHLVASEVAMDILEPRTLCLAISQSGETADLLQALGLREAQKSSILALTNNPHSSLGRRADALIPCVAGPEISVAATKTFVCQIIAGIAVMISALVDTSRLLATQASCLVDELKRIPDQLAAAGEVAKTIIPPIAEELSGAAGFIFIARGSGLPYAAEGALKLKELTYRWADDYPAGELKHGPLALVCAGTPVVVIDNADPRLATNIAEVQARGGRIVSIGGAGSTVPVTCGPLMPWGPIASAVPLQIFARTLAVALGREVDRPRNLAKSVTVE